MKSNLHGRIMNLQPPHSEGRARGYHEGHRDARHAAAELANDLDRENDRLRKVITDLLGKPKGREAIAEAQQAPDQPAAACPECHASPEWLMVNGHGAGCASDPQAVTPCTCPSGGAWADLNQAHLPECPRGNADPQRGYQDAKG
jgi:hypothetical protein